jgi:hypothetical protein
MPASLEPGELLVWEVLRNELPEEWDIYREPYVNGKRPDFAVMRHECGVVLIEVKDSPFLDSTSEVINRHAARSVKQVNRVRSRLKAVIPAYSGLSDYVELKTVVVYPFFNEDIDPGQRGQSVFSGPEWAQRLVDEIRTAEKTAKTSKFDDEVERETRHWFVEPEFSLEQRVLIKLDNSQEEIAMPDEHVARRRVRGVAGSGKTETLVARAIEIARDPERRILVICFNIVLVNYLLDRLRARARVEQVDMSGVAVLNWHAWAKETMMHSAPDGFERWKTISRPAADGSTEDEQLAVLGREVSGWLNGADRKNLELYDAVLIDEGQDIAPSCVLALQQVLKNSAECELLLMADAAQDIYQRGRDWTQEAYEGLNFRGPWKQLKVSHRIPYELAEILGWYQDTTAEPVYTSWHELQDRPRLEFAVPRLRWIQVSESSGVVGAAVQAIRLLYEASDRDDAGIASWADLVVACSTKSDGVKVAAALRADGYEVTDTFSEQNDRVKKTRFYKGASAIKVTTIHSIKGLSVTQYVLILGDGSGMNPSLVLTGLSRLKAREYSTAMTVVCHDQTLASLGEQFPHREGIFKPAST